MESMDLLYDVVKKRQTEPQENSYTCYLFEQGLDKICKTSAKNPQKLLLLRKTVFRKKLLGKSAT